MEKEVRTKKRKFRNFPGPECINLNHLSSGPVVGLIKMLLRTFIIAELSCSPDPRKGSIETLIEESKTEFQESETTLISTNKQNQISSKLTNRYFVSQTCLSYILFGISCGLIGYDAKNFEDRNSLHQLALKNITLAYNRNPLDYRILFYLACARADIRDVWVKISCVEWSPNFYSGIWCTRSNPKFIRFE